MTKRCNFYYSIYRYLPLTITIYNSRSIVTEVNKTMI